MELKSLLGLALLAAFWGAALAQDKPMEPAAPTGEPAAEARKAPAKDEEKKAPVLEIKRTGPPDCQVKPVMTDAEIETCKRAGREKHG